MNRRNASFLEPHLVKNVLAARDSPCINPLTFGNCLSCHSFLTHPIEGVVEPGEGEEEEVGVERGEGGAEGLHDAEDQVETVKGHQP